MRLVTYSVGPAGPARAGVRVGHRVLDIEAASRVNGEPMASSLKALLVAGRGAISRVQALAKAATTDARPLTQAMHEERAIRFLPPVPEADTILGIEGNCPRRNGEAAKGKAAQDPAPFSMSAAGFAGHDAKLALPAGVSCGEFGPALVFVIGRTAAGVSADDALDYVAGVTILNRYAGADPKGGGESPGSLGPEIVTMDEFADPDEMWLICTVNGEEFLRVNTRDQAWTMPEVLAHVTRKHALEPGDMYSTGAFLAQGGAADRKLEPGDVVECSIEGVTTLRTTIAAPAPD